MPLSVNKNASHERANAVWVPRPRNDVTVTASQYDSKGRKKNPEGNKVIMHVKLISITQSTIRNKEDTRNLTPEEHIVYCARVSNPSNQLNLESADKLLGYCIKHGHWSIFEQVSMGVEIKTSRAIAQQIIRHKSFSFQEFSQRYSTAQEIEEVELRAQALKNRQSSTDLITDSDLLARISEHFACCKTLYDELIASNVAKESARFVMPLATSTTLYMTGSVRSWIHYLNLRDNEHTQKEHQEIAKSVKEIFVEHFPSISLALNYNSNNGK